MIFSGLLLVFGVPAGFVLYPLWGALAFVMAGLIGWWGWRANMRAVMEETGFYKELEVWQSQQTPAEGDAWRKLLEAQELDSLIPALATRARAAIGLERCAFREEARSRLGGIPNLPVGSAWPTTAKGHPFSLLVQIGLEDLPKIDHPLPREGTLQFFVCFEGGDCEGLVRYHSRDVTLEFCGPPWEAPHRFARSGLSFRVYEDIPEVDGVFDIRSYLAGNGQKLLGYANAVQGEEDLDGRSYADAAAEILLLQVADVDLEGGESIDGSVYFLIRPDDLRVLDFSRVRVEYQFD